MWTPYHSKYWVHALTLQVPSDSLEKLDVAGREVYFVSDGLLFVSLEDHVDEELVRGVVEHEPQRFVCLDTAFDGNDRLKTNMVLQIKDSGIEFRTVKR